LLARALEEPSPRRAAGAGFVAALAAGVRYQNAFVLGCLVLGSFLLARHRWRTTAAVCVGAVLPLATSSWMNHVRAGAWNPISKGAGYLPTSAATLVGAAFGALLVAGTPPSIYLLFSPSLVATALLTGWLIVLSFAVFAVLLYHTWHQLKAVRAIHAAAEHIDPFRPAPLFAFSRLTARTGIGFLLYLVYGLVVNGDFSRAAAPAVVDYLVSITPAVACFLIPLMGMHGRLTAAKSELLAESDARIQAATAELYRRVDSGQLAGSGDARDALEGLTIVRDLTARLPTWPWSPQLLGGFVTALILPIVIWFITRALGSVLSV